MLKEIINEVVQAINAAYEGMAKIDYISYILLIGRADMVDGLRHINHSDCVIDYKLDKYYDETREGFYLRYLNRNYQREGFFYDGDSGIDDLSIEMMIYDHLWESSYFLKSLVRIASILSSKGYVWKPDIPQNGKWEYIHNNIIEPLNNKGFALGKIVEKGYSSDIRNTFAHSLYSVNVEDKTITLRPRTGTKTISFKDFQKKFLYSVILMNRMQNALERNHINACKKEGCLTYPFFTPDGILIQIKTEFVQRGESVHPEFRMVRIVE